jgi:hypothetical protein
LPGPSGNGGRACWLKAADAQHNSDDVRMHAMDLSSMSPPQTCATVDNAGASLPMILSGALVQRQYRKSRWPSILARVATVDRMAGF